MVITPTRILCGLRCSDKPASFNLVFAADMDWDGDMDVLSANGSPFDGGKVAWYENTNGKGAFGGPQVIISTTNDARQVHAADIDGDGDVDVLSVLTTPEVSDSIAWHENVAGDGTAFIPHTVSTDTEWAVSVFAADLDGDGDVDVLSASRVNGTIAWYENLLGDGTAFT